MLTIKQCALREIIDSSNLAELLAEYGVESGNDAIGPVCPDLKTYEMMENAGSFLMFGAFKEENLIGFLFLLTPILPHYTKLVAIVESIFVAKKFRGTGAGTLLRKTAEDFSKSIGAQGIIFSAPIGGSLEKVLPKAGYEGKATTFFKALK